MEVKFVFVSPCSAKYTPLEKRTSAMPMKNMSKQNSWTEARNVLPSTCRPTECRLSLNIRNTRTKRTIRSTEKDIEEFASSLLPLKVAMSRRNGCAACVVPCKVDEKGSYRDKIKNVEE